MAGVFGKPYRTHQHNLTCRFFAMETEHIWLGYEAAAERVAPGAIRVRALRRKQRAERNGSRLRIPLAALSPTARKTCAGDHPVA